MALSDLGMTTRLVRDLPDYRRRPIEPEQAPMLVARRLETRAERFLTLVERLIYRRPRSPFHRLLRMAGCEPGDLRVLVAEDGLEGTLAELARQGVYVSFDEFKGTCEIVRGSQRFAVQPTDFDAPAGRHHFRVRTGGSGGAPTDVYMQLAFASEVAITHAAALQAHGLGQANEIFWLTAPLMHLLRGAKIGHRPMTWFNPRPLPWDVRVAGQLLVALGRLASRPMPGPLSLDLDDPARLARWLADGRDQGELQCLSAFANSVVRVAEAARRQGLSMHDVAFIALGEPFTAAKQAALEAVGARAIVLYGSMETPAAAYSCGTPQAPDDCHVFTDVYGLIQRRQPVGESGLSVDAFLITTLLPSAPKVLLNLVIGDHGKLEQRDCGCPLGAVGLRTHISDLRSHEKLTGDGMTFVRTKLIPLIEEVLPARFGGCGTDYQVIEEEDRGGILRLYLLVSPSVGSIDDAEVKGAFLAELADGSQLDRYMAGVWARADTVQIRRQAPIATPAGKIQPFQTVDGVGQPGHRLAVRR